MIDEWFLQGGSPSSSSSLRHGSSLPFASFDVRQAERVLTNFAESFNKSRDLFTEVLRSNGLDVRMMDHEVCGWGQTRVEDLVQSALRRNAEHTDLMKREGNKKALTYLEDERRYFNRFLSVYQRLSPLERIAIGRSDEVKNLSMEMILLEVQRLRHSPQHHV